MRYESIPALKFEIEGMRHSILTHLGVMGSELGEVLSQKIVEAVERYPWDEQVAQITHAAITASIESYFKYGDGKRQIDAAVRDAFNKFEGK